MVSNKPKTMYRTMYPHDDLPMDADDYDEEFVASYGDFERESLMTDDPANVAHAMSMGKTFIKNNIYRDMTSDVSAISRVELNWGDGFVQHNLISGRKVDPTEMSESWFDTISSKNPEINNGQRLFLPQIYAENVYDIAFGADKIGKSDYFFGIREEFDSYFQDDPATCGCLLVDNPINPEFIGFRSKMNGVLAFNDIMSYCNATGLMFADMCTMISMLVYFTHEVLNVLVPKQIVLVMDSYRNLIDIPRKDYLPNVVDPVRNIPDYNNKMRHVVDMMKMISSGKMFYVRMGQFYLKLSITPALTTINFISAQAPNVRLILPLPTIDNQILYDAEVQHNVYPSRYTNDMNPYWHKGRNHETDKDVLMSIQSNYHDKLVGMSGGELEHFMKAYDISPTDSSFAPEIRKQVNASTPADLLDWSESW